MTDPRLHATRLLLATVVAAAAVGGAEAAAPVDLQVMAPGLKPDGPVVIALYNDPGAWAAEGQPYRQLVVPVVDGMAVGRFEAPSGRYAVAAFQDKDGDGRLDLLPFRWPLEKVGYSGGERPLFGRPSWDKADFPIVEGDRTTVFVRLK